MNRICFFKDRKENVWKKTYCVNPFQNANLSESKSDKVKEVIPGTESITQPETVDPPTSPNEETFE